MKIEGMNLLDRIQLELEWLFKKEKEVWLVYITHPGGHKHCECLCDSREDAEKNVKFLLDDSIPLPENLKVSECSIECYTPLWYRFFHKEGG